MDLLLSGLYYSIVSQLPKYFNLYSANLGTLFGTTTTNQIAVCMPFGDGNIINSVAGSAANGLNNLTSVISGLGSFSANSYVTNLTSSLASVVGVISAYSKG
jgi:hypothetical protein